MQDAADPPARTDDRQRHPHDHPGEPTPPDRATSENQPKIRNLQLALKHSREIGAAVGILMERHGLTYEDAWERLRHASQNRNLPVRQIAGDLVMTGEFDCASGSGNSSGHQALPDVG